jgi:hypothetical protein
MASKMAATGNAFTVDDPSSAAAVVLESSTPEDILLYA